MNVVPTLSDEKFLLDSKSKLNKLISYWFVADYSQSNFFRGEVSSFKKILGDNLTSPEDFANEVNNSLEDLLAKTFPTVTTNCEFVGLGADVEDVDGEYKLLLDVEIIDENNERINLLKTLEIENNTVTNIDTLLTELNEFS